MLQSLSHIFAGVLVTIFGFFGGDTSVVSLNTAVTPVGMSRASAETEVQAAYSLKDPVDASTSTDISRSNISHSSGVTTSDLALAPIATALHSASFNPHAITLGDSKVSTSPKIGYVYSCTMQFRSGGASHDGNWISGTTWDLSKKLVVQGNISWSAASFSNLLGSSERVISGNGLPVNATTGIFPIAQSDPAYVIDRNPNSILKQTISYSLPAEPTVASKPSCVPMGAIGIALNGVAIYNALDDGGRDAVAHEVQDSCNGHPQQEGEYHYHGPSPCMPHAQENNAQVGYAFDGFGIYSKYDAFGNEYTDADLDACHGITSPILWDGKMVSMYHYVLTDEYPYTLGCFKGTPLQRNSNGNSSSRATVPTPNRVQSTHMQPPQEAVAACHLQSESAACSFVSPKGTISGLCKIVTGTTTACVPQ